ncbi:MAG TPA: hypothetical protein VJK53_01510 [Candidatus Paceibacterota bacterium]
MKRPLVGHQLTLARQILVALNILFDKEVGEAGNFAVKLGYL